MNPFLANIFTRWGWSRDDLKWTLGMLAAVVVGLAALSDNAAAAVGLPPAILPYLRLGALIVGIVSGKMATSNLFGVGNVPPPSNGSSIKPGRLGLILLTCALAAGVMTSCASVGLKQKAVQAVQVSEMGLETAHDAERALFAAGAIPADKHRQLAGVFVHAFDLEIKVAAGLKLWRSGDPPPSGVADYQKDVTDILTYAKTLSADPRAQTFLTNAQMAVDKAAAIAVAVGVK